MPIIKDARFVPYSYRNPLTLIGLVNQEDFSWVIRKKLASFPKEKNFLIIWVIRTAKNLPNQLGDQEFFSKDGVDNPGDQESWIIGYYEGFLENLPDHPGDQNYWYQDSFSKNCLIKNFAYSEIFSDPPGD